MRRKRTYIGIPLKMLVDEPEGNDGGHDGEDTGYKPPNIMRCEVRVQSILCENGYDHTYVEIRHVRVEREKDPSGVPLA